MLAYLSRYAHRVAISNRRLLALDERGVTFRNKDYRREGAERYRTISCRVASTASATTACSPAAAVAITWPALANSWAYCRLPLNRMKRPSRLSRSITGRLAHAAAAA